MLGNKGAQGRELHIAAAVRVDVARKQPEPIARFLVPSEACEPELDVAFECDVVCHASAFGKHSGPVGRGFLPGRSNQPHAQPAWG